MNRGPPLPWSRRRSQASQATSRCLCCFRLVLLIQSLQSTTLNRSSCVFKDIKSAEIKRDKREKSLFQVTIASGYLCIMFSQNGDDRGAYASLQQSLVAPEGVLPTTTATVSIDLLNMMINVPKDETQHLLRDFD